MAQYKRSREEYYCNHSINNNENENPPKRSCSMSDIAGVLLLSDLLFADDGDDINAQDLQAAQDALLLDRMTILHQEDDYCNRSMNISVSDAEVQCSTRCPNLWDNTILSSCIVGESSLADSSCKMKDEACTAVSIDYLLQATDEELGIPPSPLSDHEATFESHDTENFRDGLMLPIDLLNGIETVDGIASHFTPTHAIEEQQIYSGEGN